MARPSARPEPGGDGQGQGRSQGGLVLWTLRPRPRCSRACAHSADAVSGRARGTGVACPLCPFTDRGPPPLPLLRGVL